MSWRKPRTVSDASFHSVIRKASDVTPSPALGLYVNVIIIIFLFITVFMLSGVECQKAKTEAKTYVGMARGPARRRVRQKKLRTSTVLKH